jgi:tetratricopeptide (TPR) repeat protein
MAYDYYLQGIEKWDSQDIHCAELLFQKAVDLFPTSDNLFNLANCYYSSGNSEKALATWQQSLDLKPNADTYVNMANVYATLNNTDKAVTNYQKAIELSPDDGEIHYNYAVSLEFANNLEAAIEHYQNARKLGIKEADTNLRNVLAKWAGKKAALESNEASQ